MIGTPAGYIRPGAYITRAEAATIFFRLLSDEERADYWQQTNPFTDVALRNWFNNAVSTTANGGMITGYPNGTFAPDQFITRAEMTAAVVRFMGMAEGPPPESHFNDISGHWAQGYISMAATNGWVTGPRGLSGSFYPDRHITRAETAAIVNRIFGRLVERQEDLLSDMLTWPDNADASAWYYLYIQVATNSYTFERRGANDEFERWLTIIPARDWTVLEKPESRPWEILFRLKTG